jgi:hypothetical protein
MKYLIFFISFFSGSCGGLAALPLNEKNALTPHEATDLVERNFNTAGIANYSDVLARSSLPQKFGARSWLGKARDGVSRLVFPKSEADIDGLARVETRIPSWFDKVSRAISRLGFTTRTSAGKYEDMKGQLRDYLVKGSKNSQDDTDAMMGSINSSVRKTQDLARSNFELGQDEGGEAFNDLQQAHDNAYAKLGDIRKAYAANADSKIIEAHVGALATHIEEMHRTGAQAARRAERIERMRREPVSPVVDFEG